MSTELKINEKVQGLMPKDMGELFKLAGMIANSSLAPKDYKGRPDDVAIAMMMGIEIGLNPMQSIQNIAVINGRPSIWGDALLALVQNHPAFKSIEENYDPSTETATCTVTRKGGKPHIETFSRLDATVAGLWGNNTWKKYPKRMLAMRARGFALRNQFADALLGLITTEEAYDIPVERDITPNLPVIEKLTNYSQSDFDKNFSKWESFIESGKGNATDLISKIETKAPLTEEQKNKILNIALTEQAA